jgi:hypothetical protein
MQTYLVPRLQRYPHYLFPFLGLRKASVRRPPGGRRTILIRNFVAGPEIANLIGFQQSARLRSTQPAIFARRNTYFSAEDSSEMAWASVTNIESYLDYASVGLPQ